MFCQWLPLFQLTRPQFESILRTFQAVFPEVFLVRGDFYSDLPIIGLVGGRALPHLNWQQIGQSCAEVRAGEIRDALVRHEEGVAMCILGTPLEIRDAPVNTLGNSWLEFDAARNIVGLHKPWFIGVPAAEFFRDVQRSNARFLPPDLREAHEAGQFVLTLDVAHILQLPAVAELQAQMAERLPAALRGDSLADWKIWPSSYKPINPVTE